MRRILVGIAAGLLAATELRAQRAPELVSAGLTAYRDLGDRAGMARALVELGDVAFQTWWHTR